MLSIILLEIIVILILIVMYIMYRTAKLNRILKQDLYFACLPKSFEDFRIFFIADLHRRVISDKLIDSIRNEVDLVIIGGDIVESGVPLIKVEQNVTKLKDLGPLYFVWGNNDYEIDSNELEKILLKLGVTILTNTAVSVFSKEGEKIVLLGIDDISMERDRLDLAIAGCNNKELFRILVSHNPRVKDQLCEEHGISLVLSGHTHGGQVRIFDHGPYKLGGIEMDRSCLYVTSNGYGTSTVPLRLGAKPETHVFTLKKGHKIGMGKQKEIQL